MALPAGFIEVSERIVPLRTPARRLVGWQLILPAPLATASVTVALSLHDAARPFDLAQHAYRAGRRWSR